MLLLVTPVPLTLDITMTKFRMSSLQRRLSKLRFQKLRKQIDVTASKKRSVNNRMRTQSCSE
jgi:hypothetical protein